MFRLTDLFRLNVSINFVKLGKIAIEPHVMPSNSVDPAFHNGERYTLSAERLRRAISFLVRDVAASLNL